MTELADQIRVALDDMEGWDPDGSVMARTIRAVLDKCDQIEGDPRDAFTWDGRFIATAFRATIASTLGVSTSDFPAGSSGVQLPAGDTTSPPRGPVTPARSQPRGGEPVPQALITAVSVGLAGHVWTGPLPVLPVEQWRELLGVIARVVREHDRDARWLQAEVDYDRTADAATYHQEEM